MRLSVDAGMTAADAPWDGPGPRPVFGPSPGFRNLKWLKPVYAGEHFRYATLNQAFRLVHGGAPLFALGRNRYFQEADGLSLDAGPFVAALEYASGQTAELIGKPAPAIFRAALASTGCAPADAVMMGDDVDSDVNGAITAGLRGILVKTGKYRPGDESRLKPGGVAVNDIGAATTVVLR